MRCIILFILLQPQTVFAAEGTADHASSASSGCIEQVTGSLATRGWSKEKVVYLLKTIESKDTIEFNSLSIRSLTADEFHELTGVWMLNKKPGQALYHAAWRIFGSWEAALRAAKITTKGRDQFELRSDGLKKKQSKELVDGSQSGKVQWTEDKITATIQVLYQYKDKIKLNAEDFVKYSKDDLFKMTDGKIPYQASGAAFYRAALRIFTLWPNAFKESNIDPQTLGIFVRKSMYNRKQILEITQKLYRAKIPVDQKSLWKDQSSQTKEIVAAVLGRDLALEKTVGNALIRGSKSYFTHWDEVLAELDIDPHRASGFDPDSLSKETVLVVVEIIQKDKVKMKDILKLNSKEMTEFTHGKTKGTSGLQFSHAIQYYFKNWNQAVSLLRKEYRFWKPEKFLELIRKLYEKGIPMNRGYLWENNTSQLGGIVQNILGESRTGQAIIRRGVKLYGSWDETLIHAGLDPKQIRKKFWKGYGLSVAEYQKEVIQEQGGGKTIISVKKILGIQKYDSGEEVNRGELFEIVEDIGGKLPREDREIFKEMVDVIIEGTKGGAEGADVQMLSQKLSERLGVSIGVEKVQEFLNFLSEDHRLRGFR